MITLIDIQFFLIVVSMITLGAVSRSPGFLQQIYVREPRSKSPRKSLLPVMKL